MYVGTGNSGSVAANRLSYLLDLRGPSQVVDTACSSSLVAVHQACRSLAQGECDLALAGGVNLVLTPGRTIVFSQARMMAADGRCKTFDARADGYVRGEGVGWVLLKPLSAALRDGDHVHAVIRGTAVNQDGRSNGLTAPNGPAQAAVIRDALAVAALAPEDVHYVEAHGTGTALGDPIELRALHQAYRGHGAESPLWVGAVKTNIGHLEAAAGIVGLIKAALTVEHGTIAPNLHFESPNPHAQWDTLRLQVPTKVEPWAGEGALRAGVSAFGFGGTNAHVVLEAPPIPGPRATPGAGPRLFTLSAKTAVALDASVERHATRLRASPDLALSDVCYNAHAGRRHFAHRLALVSASTSELAAQLAAGAGDRAVGSGRPRVAMLFSGQGTQYAGMGRTLYGAEPEFRFALDACDVVAREILGESLVALMHDDAADARLAQTAYSQPTLFMIEYASAHLWRARGVVPEVVVGHSVGEIAAACVAGVMDFRDGMRLAIGRGRLMQSLPEGGAMLAVGADEDTVAPLLAPHVGRVVVAAVNAPGQVVVSGDAAPIEAIAGACEAQGIRARPLPVSRAFHSPRMTPIIAEMEALASGVQLKPPRLPFVSTVTGALDEGACATAAYWRDQVARPVRFADAMETTLDLGADVFIECGPHTTLLGLGRRCAGQRDAEWLPSLRRGHDDARIMGAALGRMYVRGAELDLSDAGLPPSRVALPTYPFAHTRHWIEVGTPASPSVAESADPERSLVGRPLSVSTLGPEQRLYALTLGRDSPALGPDPAGGTGRVLTTDGCGRIITETTAQREGGAATRVVDLVLWDPLRVEHDAVEVQILIETTGAEGVVTVSAWRAALGAWRRCGSRGSSRRPQGSRRRPSPRRRRPRRPSRDPSGAPTPW